MALCASRNVSVASRAATKAAAPRLAARAVVRANTSRRNAVVVQAAAPLVGSKAPDVSSILAHYGHSLQRSRLVSTSSDHMTNGA